MRKSYAPVIRAALRNNPDGMTSKQLAESLGGTHDPLTLLKCLKTMPDAYIDRWAKTPRGPYASVWCVVVPPPNCPHPKK